MRLLIVPVGIEINFFKLIIIIILLLLIVPVGIEIALNHDGIVGGWYF